MPTWLIIIIAVLLLLALGGALARSMQLRRTEAGFRRRLEQANHDLAEAAAQDRGWDRELLEAAARRFYAEQRGKEPTELMLVEVIDRPGTDQDLAVFECGAEGARDTVRLGRRGSDWVLDGLE